MNVSSHPSSRAAAPPCESLRNFMSGSQLQWDLLDGRNTLRLWQNGCYFADNIFKSFLLNENVGILVQISLKSFPKGSVDNKSSLDLVIVWCCGPLPEPMMTWYTDIDVSPNSMNGLPWAAKLMYCKISNIRCTKSQHLNDSHLTLLLPSPIGVRC